MKCSVSPAFGLFLRLLSVLLSVVASLGATQFDQRLENLSYRASAGTGDSTQIVGFVVGQGSRKPVLIRAIGPTLSSYGITTPLSNPHLVLYNSSGLEIANNDDWSADGTLVDQLTAAFSSVGAFSLPLASKDSALIANLTEGSYTAHVTSAAGDTGTSLLEIYDLSGPSRLINLSARSFVGTDSSLSIGGLVIAGPSSKQVLIRAVGPGLTPYGITNPLPDPAVDLRDPQTGTVLYANNDWESAGNGAAIAAAAQKVGAFPLSSGSKDAALLLTLKPGIYTAVVSGNNKGSGIALLEVYDLDPDAISTVNIKATVASTDTSGSAPAQFTISRTGNLTQALSIPLSASGSAAAGTDYEPISLTASLPTGVSSTTISVKAKAGGAAGIGGRTLTLTLSEGTGYGLGDTPSATVTFFNSPGLLYVATLRPSSAALGSSVASGSASIQLSPDGYYATVNVSYSNLSSATVAAHLAIDEGNGASTYVYTLPLGQVSGEVWSLAPIGIYSTDDLRQALLQGRIFVEIGTTSHPDAELVGSFIQNTGSVVFSAPASPPALTDQPLSAAEAARFLTQATFGPTQADIDSLTGKKLADLDAWITAQMALPLTSHRTETRYDYDTFNTSPTQTTPRSNNRQAAWWKIAVNSPDQLRQRVAFALSELFVVSDQNGVLANNEEALAAYQDLLAQYAFGNYRQLLEKVSLSPIMGVWLSHLRNQKYNPATGAMPDENYAREVMQLFSIGLVQLQPDGTLKLSSTGLPIATYDIATITEMAKVFTGFSFYTATPGTTSFRGGPANYYDSMTLFPAYHEDGTKTIVTGRVLPAGQGGLKDLSDALDTLTNHPNTGPFIARRLIQRLVTSNPSPGYVYRVAQVFADNGKGVRGDLGAVVRAILMDYEARSTSLSTAAGYGKLKEPLIRVTALLRAFTGAADSGRYAISESTAMNNLSQANLYSPTVFNFFEPGYVMPGSLAANGLYAPEYQILTDTTAITTVNMLYGYLYATRGATTIGLDLSSLSALAKTPDQLVDRLNILLCSGSLSDTARARIITFLKAVPASTTDLERLRSAIYLCAASPAGAIQK
jgi:uncharacterized protein (DUF1800 family)